MSFPSQFCISVNTEKRGGQKAAAFCVQCITSIKWLICKKELPLGITRHECPAINVLLHPVPAVGGSLKTDWCWLAFSGAPAPCPDRQRGDWHGWSCGVNQSFIVCEYGWIYFITQLVSLFLYGLLN